MMNPRGRNIQLYEYIIKKKLRFGGYLFISQYDLILKPYFQNGLGGKGVEMSRCVLCCVFI